jgi:hypothetical protein
MPWSRASLLSGLDRVQSNRYTFVYMVREARTQNFMVRMAPSEMAMLHKLAEDDGLSAADIVRTLVRREYQRRNGPRPTKKRPVQ